MFETKHWDFGEVSSNCSILDAVFTHDNSNTISHFTSSCSCLTINEDGNNVFVDWKLNPNHKPPYESRKYVTVHYVNGDSDELKLTAKIV
jgi:hypothetical protein